LGGDRDEIAPIAPRGQRPDMQDLLACHRADVIRLQGEQSDRPSICRDELHFERRAILVDMDDGPNIPAFERGIRDIPRQDDRIKLSNRHAPPSTLDHSGCVSARR
jgi:hypothetical protein